MISMAPLHLTKELGYFADVGLDVTIVRIAISYEVEYRHSA